MVGFYGGAPLEYAGINELGTDAVPSSTGAVLGATFSEGLAQNITPRLFRSHGRLSAEITEEVDPAAERALDPETANREYGIKGHLTFDAPVPRGIAQDLAEHKQAQIEREDIIARREGGLLTGGAARFTTSMAAGILDPINLAVGLIPVIGPAGEAALIAGAAGAAGRAGIRAGLGAAQGAVAMAALQPLEFALSKQEREDYTMSMALRSIALGGVLGGGLHAGIGGAIDRATGRYRNPVTQRLEDAGPEARETLLQGALAQTIDGRPVDVAPALNLIDGGPLPSVADGMTRLYRGGKEPGAPLRPPPEGMVDPGEIAAWNAAQGRWFSPSRDVAEDYAFMHQDQGRVSYVDVPTVEIEKYRLSNFTDTTTDKPRLYGPPSDYENQFFLSRDLADTAELLASARRDIDAEPQARAEADHAVAKPSDTLQTIQAEIAELERNLQPPEEAAVARVAREGADAAPAGEAAPGARPAPEKTAADIAGELGESRARAVERAAVCITRG